jgi:hypothetical protein
MGLQRSKWAFVFGGALLAAAPLWAGDMAGNCRLGNQPSATLLVPYFEVDLGNPSGRNTLISVNNSAPSPVLTRMVLWTDWGIPTFAFDIYLTGYDVQTLSLRDVFAGSLPTTGPGLSPNGPLSQMGPGFPGCGGDVSSTTRVSFSAPAYLAAAHSGRPLPSVQPGQCVASFHRPGNLVTGYVTVDVVNRCSAPSLGTVTNTPADPQYFVKGGTGLASDDNVLWGDVFLLDPQNNQAASQPAISLIADASFFNSGDYTFYGSFSEFDGRDDRMPLSSLYYVRFFNGGPFSGGTDLMVWRDNRVMTPTALPCGTTPPVPGEEQLVVFDEQENASVVNNSDAFPYSTQRVTVGSTAIPAQPNFGWLMLDLWHADGTHAQGWVGSLLSGAGRFAAGHEAMRADDLCNFGP